MGRPRIKSYICDRQKDAGSLDVRFQPHVVARQHGSRLPARGGDEDKGNPPLSHGSAMPPALDAARQVRGGVVEHNLIVMAPAVELVEIRDAAVIANHSFAIDRGSLKLKPIHGFDNPAKSVCPVRAPPGEQRTRFPCRRTISR